MSFLPVRALSRHLLFTFYGAAFECPPVISSCCPSTMWAMFSSAASPKHSRKSQTADWALQARRSKVRGKGKQHQQQELSQRTEFSHKQPPLEVSSIASQLAAKDRKSQLHDELVDFAWRCAPTPASIKLAHLSGRAIELAWSKARINRAPITAVPFGSQPCAAALPGGDLDVYVESVQDGNNVNSRKLLTTLHRALEATHTFPQGSQYIRARVPIVTGTLLGGMRVDISAKAKGDDVADQGVALMQACLDAQPQARPLLLALKALMKQEGVNRVFTGGLSSFTLFNMVSGLLQHQAVSRAHAAPASFLPPLATLPKPHSGRDSSDTLDGLLARFQPPEPAHHSGMQRRFAYCVLHAAIASWLLPTPTLLEQCVEQRSAARAQQSNGSCSHNSAATSSSTSSSSSMFSGAGGSTVEEDALREGIPTGQAMRPTARRGNAQGGEERAVQGLKQVALVRAAMAEGPDLGDLLLDVLHRYGRGWTPRQDSVHLRRLDPLADPALGVGAGAGWGADDPGDILSDLEALSDADDDDKEAALGRLLQAGGPPRERKKRRPAGARAPRWADEAERDRDATYEVLSPFQAEGAAHVNLAGGASQGRRILRVMGASHRGLVQALKAHAAAERGGGAEAPELQGAADAVRAVVVYTGELPEEARQAVRRRCQHVVGVRPRAQAAHNRERSYHSNIKKGKRELGKLQVALQRAIAAGEDVDKHSRRVLRQQRRISRWEAVLGGLQDASGVDTPGSEHSKHRTNSVRAAEGLWGYVLKSGPKGASSGGKNSEDSAADSAVSSEMHAVATALAELLTDAREDAMVHRSAAAAAAALQSTAAEGAVQEYLRAHPPAAAALAAQANFPGPSGLESWLIKLPPEQLRSVVLLADWALGLAREGDGQEHAVKLPDLHSTGLGDGALSTESACWRWERARLAVQPDRTYPVLGKVLDIRKALALPNLGTEGHIRAGRSRQVGSRTGRAAPDAESAVLEQWNGEQQAKGGALQTSESTTSNGNQSNQSTVRIADPWGSVGAREADINGLGTIGTRASSSQGNRDRRTNHFAAS